MCSVCCVCVHVNMVVGRVAWHEHRERAHNYFYSCFVFIYLFFLFCIWSGVLRCGMDNNKKVSIVLCMPMRYVEHQQHITYDARFFIFFGLSVCLCFQVFEKRPTQINAWNRLCTLVKSSFSSFTFILCCMKNQHLSHADRYTDKHTDTLSPLFLPNDLRSLSLAYISVHWIV